MRSVFRPPPSNETNTCVDIDLFLVQRGFLLWQFSLTWCCSDWTSLALQILQSLFTHRMHWKCTRLVNYQVSSRLGISRVEKVMSLVIVCPQIAVSKICRGWEKSADVGQRRVEQIVRHDIRSENFVVTFAEVRDFNSSFVFPTLVRCNFTCVKTGFTCSHLPELHNLVQQMKDKLDNKVPTKTSRVQPTGGWFARQLENYHSQAHTFVQHSVLNCEDSLSCSVLYIFTMTTP